MEKQSYYMHIPASVWANKNLTGDQILLYGHITTLANKHGYAFATNGYFENIFGKDVRTIQRWLAVLENENLITRTNIYKEGTKIVEKRLINIVTCVSLAGDKDDTSPGDTNDTSPGDTNVIGNTTRVNTTRSNTKKNSKKIFDVLTKVYPKNRINSPAPILKYLDDRTDEELKLIAKNVKPYLDIAGDYVKNLRNYLEHECWTEEWIAAETKAKKPSTNTKPDTKTFRGNYGNI